MVTANDASTRPAQRVEVFTRTGRRRVWLHEEKVRIVGEIASSSNSVCAVARRHGLQRHRFGRRAETLPEDQMLLGLEDVEQNINRYGERIYHMQNQSFYTKIRMDKGGDRRWFCTPEEAEAAGWRRALR